MKPEKLGILFIYTESEFMRNNIINVVTKVYKYLMAGMYFWGYILRGLIVYGLLPAMCCLLKATDELFLDAEDRPVGHIFRDSYKKVKSLKLQSFLVFMYHSLLIVAAFFVSQQEGDVWTVVLVLLIYLLVMGFINITYTTYFISFKEMTFKDAFIQAFLASIKHPIASIAVLAILFISGWIGYMNLVAMIFVAPALYALVVKLLFVNRI